MHRHGGFLNVTGQGSHPRQCFSAGSGVQEGQPAAAGNEVLRGFTVLIVHSIHHFSLQHRVASHEAAPQLALLSNAGDAFCSVTI